MLCKFFLLAVPLTILACLHFLSSNETASSSTTSSSFSLRGSAPQDVQVLHFQMVFFGHHHTSYHSQEDEKERSLGEIRNLMCSVNEFILIEGDILEDEGETNNSIIKNINWIDSDSTMTFRFTIETENVDMVTAALLKRKDYGYQAEYSNPELLKFLKAKNPLIAAKNGNDDPSMTLGNRVSLQALTPERAKDLEEVRAGALKEIQCTTNPTAGAARFL